MSRQSSHRSQPGAVSAIYQNFIDAPIAAIEVRCIRERDLAIADIEWLFGFVANSPRSVGISPAYSQSGGMPALAFALGERALVIELLSSKAEPGADSSVPRMRNAERRKLLEKELLCHPDCTFYAFDFAPVVLSIYIHLQVHLSNGIDIQSALPVPSRSPEDSVHAVIGDALPVYATNITTAFDNMLYGTDKKKAEQTALVQRAWLSGYIGQYDSSNVKDMFYAAPKIDLKKFSKLELGFMTKLAHDMLRLDILKPQSVTHEVKFGWNDRAQQMKAQSQRYANRMIAGSRVKVTVAAGPSASFTLSGESTTASGRSAHVDVQHNLEDKVITSITSFGRGVPTQAEFERSHTILCMLQGTIPLFENHWMKALWQPTSPISWPESFFPTPIPPPLPTVEHPDAPLNPSQKSAITSMLSFSSDTCIIPIQGPPGTGKTTVIATYVLSAIEAEQKGIWLMAQSNVAVKNIAEKLAKLNFYNFKLLVSKDFHFEWHEHLYTKIQRNIIRSDTLPPPAPLKKLLQSTQVILCTLSMISSKRLQSSGLMRLVPISNVVIDEASQIEIGQYVPLFKSFGHSLRKMCFIGDDRQLPPHGQDDLGNLQSIFELEHLKGLTSFLDTQYRMPPQIGEFISKEVYEGKLNSYPQHPVKAATTACHFVDVPGLEKLDSNGKSYLNDEEVAAAMLLARHLEEEGTPYRLITPYDAQRSALEHALQDAELDWHDKCFNVDSFQGNEDHVIVISVVRTKALGFLSSVRRTNVMLTRCQRGMYILSSRAFLAGKGADSLVGKMAAELGTRPGAWLTRADLEAAKFE